ncbi:MAG: aspartyl protease family protein [Gemmataceae bacterium]
MGIFRVDAEIINTRQPARKATVPQLLVDSGSEFTWVPEAILKRAGVQVVKKDVPFVMANGQTITRSMGYAIVRAEGFETIDEVVFAQPGDLSLLGSRTLEGFGASIDAGKKKLVAAGPHPAAGS